MIEKVKQGEREKRVDEETNNESSGKELQDIGSEKLSKTE